MSDERRHDERLDKILETLNALKLNIEKFHIKCSGDMALSAQIYKEHGEKITNHSETLYDPKTGLCKIVSVDHERLSTISKLIWGIGGAIIVLTVNAFGKLVLK